MNRQAGSREPACLFSHYQPVFILELGANRVYSSNSPGPTSASESNGDQKAQHISLATQVPEGRTWTGRSAEDGTVGITRITLKVSPPVYAAKQVPR